VHFVPVPGKKGRGEATPCERDLQRSRSLARTFIQRQCSVPEALVMPNWVTPNVFPPPVPIKLQAKCASNYEAKPG